MTAHRSRWPVPFTEAFRDFGVVGIASAVMLTPVSSRSARAAGILLPVFSTRREGDFGIGDTRGLREWIDWSADHGVGFIQLLPIHEHGADESPYSAISSHALDPIHLPLDRETLPWLGLADFDRARVQLGRAADAPSVDYAAVRPVKRRLLELAWARFDEAPQELVADFARFRDAERGWLEDYAMFRYSMELHGEDCPWDRWPEHSRTPDGLRSHLAQLRREDAAVVDYRLGYYAFVQWLCFREWHALRGHADERGVKLMGDVPIGVSWHSCDVFFHRDLFHLDWCGGSPSEGISQQDPFFREWGQNWGIPLYRWDRMEADGFQWWKSRIERLTTWFHLFRLDHILGFYRIYAFPWRPERNHEFVGLDAGQAAAITGGRLPQWFPRPDDTDEHRAANLADGDRRLRALLDAAGDAEVIAEDLGWVPDYVRPHLERLGIAGYRIPHWDCGAEGHPAPGSCFPELSFAAYSTHDHDPVCAIWRGCIATIRRHEEHPDESSWWQADGARHALRVLSEFAGIPIRGVGSWPPFSEGVRLRLIKALLDCRSRRVSLMITSLFGLDQRINHPGTSGPHNWSFRLPWTLRQIAADPALADVCRKFANAIELSGRRPMPGGA